MVMKIYPQNRQGGLIKMIIIIVIALIVLGYYGIDIKKVVEAPTTQSNMNYATQVTANVWHSYLEKPSKYVWNEIVLKLISAATLKK
jgi:predicted metalloprotease